MALKVVEAVVARCTIAAPWPGRVAERHVQRYQSVGEGQPLLDVLDDRTLEVEMIVPSTGLAWLKPGHRFELAIDETGERYAAELDGSARASIRSASRSRSTAACSPPRPSCWPA